MQRRHLLPLAVTLLLAGCAGFGGPRVITLNEADLNRIVDKNFPLERRAMELIELRVERPRVSLLPETNKLATELDVQASERLSARSWRGQMSLEYGLRYDEGLQAVRATQVRVKRLQFDGASEQLQPFVDRIGSVLAEQVLNDAVIYRFRPEDLGKAQSRGVQPGAVTVTARGVEITLVPSPAY
jgi:hypothetical protein